MTITNKNIVFDTNVFGNLVSNKNYDEISQIAIKINQHSNENNYNVLLDLVVCSELLKHLKKDTNHKDYIRCKKSIFLISKIVNVKISNTFQNKIIKHLFDKYDDTIVLYEDSIKIIIQELSRSDFSDYYFSLHKDSYLSLESDWIQNRNNLIDSFFKGIKTDLNINDVSELEVIKLNKNRIINYLNDPSFNISFTLSIVLQVLKFKTDEDLLENKKQIDILIEKLNVASVFYKNFWKSIIEGLSTSGNNVNNDYNNKRWNSINDILILISTLLSDSIFISNEIKIGEAYKETNNINFINFSDYYQEIEMI
jgi:hypothetical protein